MPFLDILYWEINDAWFYKGGKCGCVVLINKWFFVVNLPYGQSDLTVNPGPTFELISYFKDLLKDLSVYLGNVHLMCSA